MRDDDGTLQWFKEYVYWIKTNKYSLASNVDVVDKYIVLLNEMVEICTHKQEKYSWEK